MSKRWIHILVAVLSVGAIAWADTELFTCSESGQGPTYLKVCVSDTGNVTLFESPKGQEHIRYIVPGLWVDYGSYEGYMVCREPEWDGPPPYQTYFDGGNYYPDPSSRSWQRGWHPPYRIDQPGGSKKFPVIIYRRSSDGIFELKQEFSVDAVEREITITMTLYNRSKQRQRDVRLVRIVDLDIDATGEDEEFLTGKRSVVEYDYGPPYGGNRDAVSLVALTPNLPVHFSRVGYDEYDLCYDYGWGNPSNGMSGVVYVFGDLSPGGSRTAKYVYRAF